MGSAPTSRLLLILYQECTSNYSHFPLRAGRQGHPNGLRSVTNSPESSSCEGRLTPESLKCFGGTANQLGHEGRPAQPPSRMVLPRHGLSPSVRAKVARATRRLPSTWQPWPRPATASAFSFPTSRGLRVTPLTTVGLRVMSMGFFVGEPPARHMAAPDAPQSARTAPRQARLGWPRFAGGGHAARDRATWRYRCRGTCLRPRSTWSRCPSPRPGR